MGVITIHVDKAGNIIKSSNPAIQVSNEGGRPSNYCKQNMTRSTVYHGHSVCFEESNDVNTGSKKTFFYKKKRVLSVKFKNSRVTVTLDDGTKGMAKCAPGDKFNPKYGYKVAYLRAKVKSCQKRLDALIQEGPRW